MTKRIFFKGMAFVLAAVLAGMPVSAMAKVKDDIILTTGGMEDYMAASEKRKSEPVDTNKVPGWPQGPAVSAAGAIVMDADSGEVLYGKNVTKHLYPASITKIMTGLLAYENLKPTDIVTFSQEAVYSIELGSSHIGIDPGESITVDEALYGLMVASANEVANALGERVSGSQEAFAALMNERAKQLGCENTHFVTLNGLHSEDHYTCVYDMALIAREAYKYPDLINYMSKDYYNIPPSDNQPDDIWMRNTNDFLNGAISCEDVIAGKTGYTDQARETLVSFAERDGKRLICVIMKDEPPNQYYNTIDLLNYAFDNFKKIDISEEEKRFTLSSPDFLSFGRDIFGNSGPSFSIRKNTSLLIPKNSDFSDLNAEIVSFMKNSSGTDASKKSDILVSTNTDTQTAAVNTEGTDPEGTSSDSKDTQGSDDSGTASSVSGQDGRLLADDENTAFTEEGSRILGTIHYSFQGYELGTAQVVFNPKALNVSSSKTIDNADKAEKEEDSSSSSETAAPAETELPDKSSLADKNSPVPEEVHGIRSLFFGLVHTGSHGSIYLNILLLLPLLLAVSFVLCIFFYIHNYFVELEKRRRRSRRRAARSGQGRTSGNYSRRSSSGSGERNYRRKTSGRRRDE